jgi:small conductance mechanosensitive channel
MNEQAGAANPNFGFNETIQRVPGADSILTRIDRMEEVMGLYGIDLIIALVVLILGLLAAKYLNRLLRTGLSRIIANAGVVATISSVFYVVVIAVVILAAAAELGFQLRPLVRLLTVVVLCAIGAIVLFRPYIPTLPFKVGQTVKAANLLGKVEATTVLNTRIKTFDGKMVFVPNKAILNDVVINYHATPARRMKLDIPIRYDQDLLKAKQVLEALMIADPRVLKTPRPAVWVLDLSRGCVMLGGRCWADNQTYWQTRIDLLEKAKYRFDQEGIVISYPHLGVHHYEPSFAASNPRGDVSGRGAAAGRRDDDEGS